MFMVIVLAAQSLAFGLPRYNLTAVLVLGLTKAFSWYFGIQTVCGGLDRQSCEYETKSIYQARQCSWRTTAAIGIYTFVSTRDPFTQSSDIRALLQVVASFLTLSQIVHLLPKSNRSRSPHVLWVFCLVPLVPYLIDTIAIRHAQTSSVLVNPQAHPVQILMQSARVEFDSMMQRQSKNYTAAHEEYRRRYGMEPPPGFAAWYDFAKLHNSPIIDEFDIIHESILPFFSLDGEEILNTMQSVQDITDSELWACAFSGQDAKTNCRHSRRTFDRNVQLMLDTLLQDLHGILPEVKFLVNHIDEPRVLIPRKGDPGGDRSMVPRDMSRRPVWETLTKYCANPGPNMTTKWLTRLVLEEDSGLPFVRDPVFAMDLCRHMEYGEMHGLAMSPTSFPLIEALLPVLSTGSPSTMGDILYPSPAYMEPEFRYVDANDVEWDSKRNNLYWAGSTTGGYAQDEHWRHYHRQRFVELAQNLRRRRFTYLREIDGVLSRVQSFFLNSRIFDVAFTRIFQCEKRYCRDQRAYFDVKSWEDKDQAFRSRLVFDVDGNGISGRYYKLLASRSTPLKQTLLREWHDERLVPWVHYVPVSQGMEELPELVSHLTSSEAGREGARTVAEQGREWFHKALREVDRTIYIYRLFLELARLQDPRRRSEHKGADQSIE